MPPESKTERSLADFSDLTGKRALITGGSRGIGRSTALVLAEAGVRLALLARGQAELEKVQTEIQGVGVHCIGFRCDVSDPEQVQETVTLAAKNLGGIDILVNNAGAASSHPFLDHPDPLWHSMLDANLNSVYYVSKAVVPFMVLEPWGRIVTIASIASKVGAKYVAAYTAAKHGVLGLTRALAVELVDKKITVNAVCPGYVNTPLTEASVDSMVERTGRTREEILQTLRDMNPQRRLIEPEEVAGVVLMLVRESSRGVTGQAINVDGGAVMI